MGEARDDPDGLPDADIALLFTDIEGSTAKWERCGSEMRDALARHDALLDAAVVTHRGTVLKSMGDGIMASFAEVADAVAAAVDAQHRLADEDFSAVSDLRVRMGIHAGPVHHRDGDVFGPTVNRCARVMDAGHGGQVLLSDPARERLLGATDLGDAHISTIDLGVHRLKGLGSAERLHQLCHPDLAQEFPRLRTATAVVGNLPKPPSLVGRDDVAARLRELVESAPIVTLIGPGGVGKTSLALRVGTELQSTHPDGVWFVELAPADASTDLVALVGQVLGVQGRPDEPLDATLRAVLDVRRALLVLDNAEHVREGVADLLGRLLTPNGNTRALVTSRGPLGVAGEVRLHLDPLLTPDRAGLRNLDDVARCPALQLFVDRAAQARPGYALTEENLAAAVNICNELDGLPLAVELAAARAEVLSTEQIAALLTRRFRLLQAGTEHDHRHRTLTAVLDWSFELLSDTARTAYPWLGVFASAFDLEAAAAVCELDELDMLDVLSELVNNSLVATESLGDSVRYYLLETMVAYAELHLDTDPTAETVRRRHATHHAGLAATLYATAWSDRSLVPLDRCDLCRPDLRRAFQHLLAVAPDEALAMVTDLYPLWLLRDLAAEGLQWLQEAIAANGGADGPATPELVRALDDAGTLAWVVGEGDTSERMCQAAVEAAERMGASPPPKALVRLGSLRLFAGDEQGSRELCRRAHDIARSDDHPDALDVVERTLGSVLALSGDREAGIELSRQALDRARASGLWLVSALTNYALAVHQSDPHSAIDAGLEAVDEARRIGSKYYEASARAGLAASEWILRERDASCRTYAEAITLMLDTGAKSTALIAVDRIAQALMQVAPEPAVRLASGSAHRSAGPGADGTWDDQRHSTYRALVGDRLADDEFERAWTEGSALTLDEMGALAVATVDATIA